MSTPNFSFNDKKATTTRVNAQIKAIGETVKMTKATGSRNLCRDCGPCLSAW